MDRKHLREVAEHARNEAARAMDELGSQGAGIAGLRSAIGDGLRTGVTF